jgi:hypothetical protein
LLALFYRASEPLLNSFPTQLDAPCDRNRDPRERCPSLPVERFQIIEL